MHHYRESIEESRRLAELVLSETEKRRIRPNPINFTIWYEYLLKRDPFVAQSLDREFSIDQYDEMTEELFNHIVGRLCLMSELEHVVLKLINEVIGDIDGWEDNLDAHASVMNRALHALAQSSIDPLVAASLVKEVVGCVGELTQGAEQFKNKLLDVRTEVNRLKHELEVMHREAHTDPLTGLGNRRAIDKFLMQHLPSNQATEESFSCIMLDVDFFKRINDSEGHLVGDSVLRFIAKTLQSQTKGQDFVGRFGGEEFVILLPHTACQEAFSFAEKLRKTFEKTELKVKSANDKRLRMTISLGLSTYRLGEEITEFLERADQALYVAKQTGRNRVVSEKEFMKYVETNPIRKKH